MPEFDLVAASLRADATDLHSYVEALAVKLELSFPGRCRVERAGVLRKGGVRRISLELGDLRYDLTHDSGAVTGRRFSVVRGIALKSEELSLDAWVDSLSTEVVAEANRSERGRLAVEKLLNG